MRKSISYVVSELIAYRRSSIAATKQFEKWKHNEDLYPKLEEQLNRIREGFLKYHSVAMTSEGRVMLRAEDFTPLPRVTKRRKSLRADEGSSIVRWLDFGSDVAVGHALAQQLIKLLARPLRCRYS